MIPAKFGNSNCVMHAPNCKGKCEDPACMCVDAFRNDKYVITCWQPTETERVRLALGEPVYLVCSGGMPPVSLMVESPFEQKEA